MLNKFLKSFIVLGFCLIFCSFLKVNSYGVDIDNFDSTIDFSIDNVVNTVSLKEIEENKELEKSDVCEEKVAKPVKIEEKKQIVWAKEDAVTHEKYNIYSEETVSVKKHDKLQLTGECENGWSELLIGEEVVYIETEKLLFENPIKTEGLEQYKSNEPIIVPEGMVFRGASDEIKRMAIRYWNLIPSNIRTSFVNDGWEIVITSESLESLFGYSFSIIGLTTYGEERIYVEARENAIRRALCHEMGHYWDWKNDWLSDTDEWKDIFYDERYKFNEQYKADNHCVSSTVEYFAEIFAQALMYPDTAYSSAPRSCNYIWN